MSKPYTPLFNRTYLTILTWFSAITVVILATQSGGNSFPELERVDESSVYWTEFYDAGQGLSVLIPTRSGITPKDKAQQYLLQSLVDAKLATTAFTAGTAYSTKIFTDYVELQINWPSTNEAPDLNALWALLSSPVPAPLTEHLSNQANAKSYIQSNKRSNDLKDTLLTSLYISSPQSSNVTAPLFIEHISNASVVVYGDDAEDIAETISNEWALKPHPFTLRDTATDVSALKQQSAGKFTLVAGQVLSPRTSQDYYIDRIAVGAAQLALDAHSVNTGISYAIKYAGLHDTGYAIFEFTSDYPVESQFDAITQQITEAHVEQAKLHIINQWQSLNENPLAVRDALNRNALYQLEADAIQKVKSAIEDSDIDAIASKTTAFFTLGH